MFYNTKYNILNEFKYQIRRNQIIELLHNSGFFLNNFIFNHDSRINKYWLKLKKFIIKLRIYLYTYLIHANTVTELPTSWIQYLINTV